MREIDKIAENLFDKIRSRFSNVNLGDETAKRTQDPERARFFNFDFDVDGETLGNVTISLIDEKAMKVYFGSDIIDNIKQSDGDENSKQEAWYDFLRNLRKFAKRNMLNFDTRDVAKSNLQLKDIKQQTKADDTVNKEEINVTESRLYGTSRHSFMEVGPCKLRIIHSDSIDEEQHGARSRKIDQIFIETPHGERFLVPHKHLGCAAALATHIAHGGEHNDDIAECMNGMVAEMGNMSHFVRSVKRRTDLDDETGQMAHAAINRYNELKNKLKRLRSPRHYLDFVENYMPESAIEEEYDVDALRERFVKKMYDERFDAALPFVYRAHKRQQESMNTPMAEEFESWANGIVEGTWAMPESEEEVRQLVELMSKPLQVGVNGEDATSALYSVIGDDQLFDDIHDMADIKGEEYDCRPEVLKWVKQNMPAIVPQIEAVMQNDKAQPQPGAEPVLGTTQPAEQPVPAATPPVTPAQPVMQSADPLDFIRSLAGLRR
jgi:hypothetical protein